MVDLLDSVRAFVCPRFHALGALYHSLFLFGAIRLPLPLHDSAGGRRVARFA